ncbi:MAG: MFS transporter, partial [Methanospirillum sp.]|nr:MFS transporter [Methanospirillum sp.]
IVLAYLSGWITDKKGPRTPCIIGMSFCIVAGVAFHGFDVSTTTTYIFLSLVIFGVGIGLFVPASVALIMNQSGATNKGTISSLKSLAVQFGSITGVTLCTILYSVGFSGQKVSGTLSQIRLVENFSHAMTFILICALLCLLVCIAAKKPLQGINPRE